MDTNSLILPLSDSVQLPVLFFFLDSVQLPVIYFLDETLTPGTSKWDKVNADIREALEQFGCFEVSLTKCQWSLISLFSKPWKSFSIFPLRPNRETCCRQGRPSKFGGPRPFSKDFKNLEV